MKKILIYNINQYTKTGKLKKKAQHEMGITTVGETTEKEKLYSDKQNAETIKRRGYTDFIAPYFFSHIECKNDKGERCIIIETITIGSDNCEIVTTPQTLFNNLTKK